jgi:hypothetical protein
MPPTAQQLLRGILEILKILEFLLSPVELLASVSPGLFLFIVRTYHIKK